MADWAAPAVIDPELEAWVFSASPHVPDVIGWKQSRLPIRKALEVRNLWAAADAKPAGSSCYHQKYHHYRLFVI